MASPLVSHGMPAQSQSDWAACPAPTESLPAGRHLTVLDVSVVGQAKTELRIITGLMEQVATDFEGEPLVDGRSDGVCRRGSNASQVCCGSSVGAGVADTVQQVEAKWKTVVEAIGSVRAGLAGLLRDMGLEHNRDEDLKQLERLLILGETACAENVMHQYLTSTLGDCLRPEGSPVHQVVLEVERNPRSWSSLSLMHGCDVQEKAASSAQPRPSMPPSARSQAAT